MNDNAQAIADLKEFNNDELATTALALEAAKSLRATLAQVREGDREDIIDLIADFALDDDIGEFDDKIALVHAEIASRAS